MLFVQFGFLVFLDFADLTCAMLLMHLFTFNPKWVKAKVSESTEMVYYDGDCGFCHWFIKLLLSEDKGLHFKYSPLGSDHFNEHIEASKRDNLPDSVIVHTAEGEIKEKSEAVAHCLIALGGLWVPGAPGF